MAKISIVFLVVGFIFIGGSSGLQAQSLSNSLKGTKWKFYVESLRDTLTMHIGVDTSFTLSSSGDLIVKSVSSMRNDTLRIRDFSGEYYCPDGEGVYKVSLEGDYLTFFLITDPCRNRGEVLSGMKFRKVN